MRERERESSGGDGLTHFGQESNFILLTFFLIQTETLFSTTLKLLVLLEAFLSSLTSHLLKNLVDGKARGARSRHFATLYPIVRDC